jgi:hypothetical protein
MAVQVAGADEIRNVWRSRITQAREDQTSYHGIWATALAFSYGQQWLVWSASQKKLRHISDVGDPKYQGRELFTADRITEQRQAALGELTVDDDRPELMSAQEGDDANRAAAGLNQIAAFAWDQEWKAPAALMQMRRLCLDLGVAAIRCRWDGEAGPPKNPAEYAPLGSDGTPLDPQAQLDLVQNGALSDGSLPQFKKLNEGRTVLDVYSQFQIFSPPGIVHEDNFPWEIVGGVVLVDEIKEVYGVSVSEDTGIVSSTGLLAGAEEQAGQGAVGRLRDHAWLYSCFQRPSRKYPAGRTATIAGTEFIVCDAQDELPYKLGDEYDSGIRYFHWWRASHRFRSRGIVQGMEDPQRVLNRRKTQNVEIFDRGMPKMIARKGDYPGDLTGAPLEVMELDRNAQAPQITPGIQPSPVMYQDIASLDEDLSHASTISPLRLGENPNNVDTYSQLAMLNDLEQGKRGSILTEHRRGIGDLEMLAMSDVEKYWPDEKQGLVLGPEQIVEQVTLKKSEIPSVYRVKPASGSPLPRSQGAQVKLIDAVGTFAVQAGVTAQDPQAWVDWYKRSLEAGEAQKLPSAGTTSQEQIVALENMEMRQGQWVEPTYYDPIDIHVHGHREEENRARMNGDDQAAAMIEQHIQAHLKWAMANAANNQGAAAPPGPPGAPMPQPGGGSGLPGAGPPQPPGSPTGPSAGPPQPSSTPTP